MFGKNPQVLFKVRYNGRDISPTSCADPKVLKPGKVYKVISVEDKGLQTNYTLLGIKGNFNSACFDDV